MLPVNEQLLFKFINVAYGPAEYVGRGVFRARNSRKLYTKSEDTAQAESQITGN